MSAVLARLNQHRYVLPGLVFLALAAIWVGGGLRQAMLALGGVFWWQIVSGVLLLAALIYQWWLVFDRLRSPVGGASPSLSRHHWVGVASIVVFAVHAVEFGHIWTSALALGYLGCALCGVLNRQVVRYRNGWSYTLWLLMHIGLAAVLVPLVVGHVWAALFYQGGS